METSMKTTQQLNKFIATISKDTVKQVINDNNLNLLVNAEYTGTDKNAHISIIRNNRSKYTYNLYTLLNIRDVFCKNNIPLITFKGMSLAKMLYQDRTIRPVGDIDIYVGEEQFETAINLLFGIGFSLKKANGLDNVHHVVLTNKYTVIELHRHILTPLIGVSEKYLLNHTGNLTINKVQIKTFDVTATLLHLIYHLYMDTYLASNNIYFFTNRKQFGIAKRFIFRAYEIALFAEKYFKDIKWNDIISDIKTQKLRIIFKYMVDDILEIFPNAFPQELKKAIYNKSYIKNEDDMLFYKFLEGHKNHKQEKKYLLCEFIEKFWQKKNNNALLNLDGSAIVLEDKDFNEFKCICNISRNDKKIHIEFTIEDDDIFFSDLGNYDTQKSDGIHLILCSTTDYSYNSIFFFPKNTKENNKVIPYDFLESKVVENDIIASYEMIKNGYKINVTLTEGFITKNHLESFFYLGLVVSSCSSKTKHREKQLVLSSPADQWYNPLHFAKINI